MNPAKLEWHKWDGRVEDDEGRDLYPNGWYLVEFPHNQFISVYAENSMIAGRFDTFYKIVSFCDWMGCNINHDEIKQIALLKED